MITDRPIYKLKHGALVEGTIFNVLLHHGDYTLVDLKVYADGEIDCLGPVTWDKLRMYFETGKLTHTLPRGASLFIPHVGYVVSKFTNGAKGYEDFLSMVENTIVELRSGKVSLQMICYYRFKDYLLDPHERTFETLKEAYDRLPEGQKACLETDDRKDPLLKLMNGGALFTREEREYLLNDYYDGAWIEMA
jgi:hypothetical protein